jgi:hypothetical protein
VGEIKNISLSLGRKGGQASNEDLLPLGYGERDRVRVRVKIIKEFYHFVGEFKRGEAPLGKKYYPLP